MRNWDCEKGECVDPTSDVRKLPTGGGANAILCRSCFENEIQYRKDRNKTLHPEERFATPRWEDLEVYEI